MRILIAFLSLVLLAGSCSTRGSYSRYELRADSIISLMTLEEKVGQMTLLTSGWDVTGPSMNENYMGLIREGKCGNVFNAFTAEYTRKLQQIAVEETRLHIPLLFGYDVIHGFKTIFPIPLAESCSWDTAMVRESARLSAKEAAAAGLTWTFNPMVDIARDPRWGRVAEGSGEDPFLGSAMAIARVRGYQGDDLSDVATLLACVKHYAAYGASQAGRDYHTTDMSERQLRNVYLPPYRAAVDAGVGSLMTSFNDLNGIPVTGNRKLVTSILRNEWGFAGFVVTDYTSMNELVPHGYARDVKHSAELALNAGVDMDMQGSAYLENLSALVEEGKVSIGQIDRAVKRILVAKYKLGLFDDPYRYCSAGREREVVFSKEMMDHARSAATKSIVLLKNDSVNGSPVLPLSTPKRIALIGPLGADRLDMLGTWHAAGDESKVITLLDALKSRYPDALVSCVKGCEFLGEDKSGFGEAIRAARGADVVILAVGESFNMSGEAASRSMIGLPGVQNELVREIAGLGRPVVMVVLAGRPLTIEAQASLVPSVVYAWHLGTMAGPAIADVLSGDVNPSGRLVMTFPRNVGQIPIFYSMKNTGRPFDANNKYTSKYLDIPNSPLYPFGYGLSYTSFAYSDLNLSAPNLDKRETLRVTVTIRNTGSRAGEETVQLYVRDLVGTVTRPVKELKGFEKLYLEAGGSKKVTFSITERDLRFYDADMQWTSEPGDFKVFVGSSSAEGLEANFTLR